MGLSNSQFSCTPSKKQKANSQFSYLRSKSRKFCSKGRPISNRQSALERLFHIWMSVQLLFLNSIWRFLHSTKPSINKIITAIYFNFFMKLGWKRPYSPHLFNTLTIYLSAFGSSLPAISDMNILVLWDKLLKNALSFLRLLY